MIVSQCGIGCASAIAVAVVVTTVMVGLLALWRRRRDIHIAIALRLGAGGIQVAQHPGVLAVRNPRVLLLCAVIRELCTGKIASYLLWCRVAGPAGQSAAQPQGALLARDAEMTDVPGPQDRAGESRDVNVPSRSGTSILPAVRKQCGRSRKKIVKSSFLVLRVPGAEAPLASIPEHESMTPELFELPSPSSSPRRISNPPRSRGGESQWRVVGHASRTRSSRPKSAGDNGDGGPTVPGRKGPASTHATKPHDGLPRMVSPRSMFQSSPLAAQTSNDGLRAGVEPHSIGKASGKVVTAEDATGPAVSGRKDPASISRTAKPHGDLPSMVSPGSMFQPRPRPAHQRPAEDHQTIVERTSVLKANGKVVNAEHATGPSVSGRKDTNPVSRTANPDGDLPRTVSPRTMFGPRSRPAHTGPNEDLQAVVEPKSILKASRSDREKGHRIVRWNVDTQEE